MDGVKNRIGFVSTRLAGTDGVSLETAKWVRILRTLGYDCFYFAGELDWPDEYSYLVPEAHFSHPEILRLQADLFGDFVRSPETSAAVHRLKVHLKQHLYTFTRRFKPDLLVIENALAIPMNVPLGLAVTEFIAETNYPTIGHHHDFVWERDRFSVSAADDYLRAAFPPTLNAIHHVVINSFAGRQLALRSGVSTVLIPNVMDFDTPLPDLDEHAVQLRDELGIQDDECLLLQPTRIVPRKRIEHAIDLARRLKRKAVLVISHASGDEGTAYETHLRQYAEALNVRVMFAGDRINHERRQTPDGRGMFSLSDVYQQADLVTYPSSVEGFGNAFLETIYFRRPIVMSSYEIFKVDIQPKGFKVITFEDFITEDTVQQVSEVLDNPSLTTDMVNHNFQLGRQYYSYRTLEEDLVALIGTILGRSNPRHF